jgi:hypothetical protein
MRGIGNPFIIDYSATQLVELAAQEPHINKSVSGKIWNNNSTLTATRLDNICASRNLAMSSLISTDYPLVYAKESEK